MIEVTGHECGIATEMKTTAEVIYSKQCFDWLFANLAAEDIFGPVTFQQCLLRNGHTEECVKDWTSSGWKDAYVRKVQIAFLRTHFAKNWAKPHVTRLLEGLSKNVEEVCQFLFDIQEKRRKGHYENDETFFLVCRRSANKKFYREIIDKTFQLKDATLIISAFKNLFMTMPAPFIEKIKSAIITPDNKEIFEKICSYLGKFAPDEADWALFQTILEENYRVSNSLKSGILFVSHSTSQKKVIDVDEKFYWQLKELSLSNNPNKEWGEISQNHPELKKEHAYACACVLTQARFTRKDKKKLFDEVLKDFLDNTVATLAPDQQKAIKLMLDAKSYLDTLFKSIKSGKQV